jgi:hypothetical protein
VTDKIVEVFIVIVAVVVVVVVDAAIRDGVVAAVDVDGTHHVDVDDGDGRGAAAIFSTTGSASVVVGTGVVDAASTSTRLLRLYYGYCYR